MNAELAKRLVDMIAGYVACDLCDAIERLGCDYACTDCPFICQDTLGRACDDLSAMIKGVTK